MNIMAHKTKEKTKENTKEKTKEIFLDCLVLKTLEFTKDITMDFGSRESLEIGNQGIDQAPRNIPWFLEAIPKEDVSWGVGYLPKCITFLRSLHGEDGKTLA